MTNSYEGVEALANFPSRQALESYRSLLLEKSRAQAAFVRERCPSARTVFEICCGNGRLLIAMADHFEGLSGFDIAETRVAFAKAWIEDLGLGNVELWRDDALAPSARGRCTRADLVLCVTGAYAYFDAVRPDGGRDVLDLVLGACRPGGSLVLELYMHPLEVRRAREAGPDGSYRTWSELPAADPFRFYLSELRWRGDQRVLEHRKTFVSRRGEIDDARHESLRIYEAAEVERLLSPFFSEVHSFSSWDADAYTGREDALIVLAAGRR